MKKSVWLLLIGAALIVGAYFLKQYETRSEFEEAEEEKAEPEPGEKEETEPLTPATDEKESGDTAGK